MSLEILPVFAVPFAQSFHPAAKTLNRELADLFLERESAGQQYANPKATMQIGGGLFESRFDLFKWQDPCVRVLRDFCWGQLYQLVGELNGYDSKKMAALTGHADAWFHITRRGGYFGIHNHPMASWSGVYCVDSGSDLADQSGKLSFPHPNGTAAMFVDAGVKELGIPFSMATREFALEAGQLLLFPSWLPHQVLPFTGSGTRITVAFNAWFANG